MKKKSVVWIAALWCMAAALAQPAAEVKVTPLGSHDGELCPQDRALIFEDPNGTRILYDAGRTVAGASDPRLGKIDIILVTPHAWRPRRQRAQQGTQLRHLRKSRHFGVGDAEFERGQHRAREEGEDRDGQRDARFLCRQARRQWR